MEAWRQRLLGRRKNRVQRTHTRIDLTPTGLLMEGDSAQNASMSVIEMLRQPSEPRSKLCRMLVEGLVYLRKRYQTATTASAYPAA